ncbi:MAG: ABC transporter substrate-binding protein [Actinomycetia bacterium]|nr:ABC transporter substrate-binding protein [Actinomycetes bacterium]
MNRKRWWLALLGILASFTLVAGACSSDDSDDEDSSGGDSSGDSSGGSDDVLKIGTLLPETGDLAFLGPPEFAGAELAVQEINDAGGVCGKDVELTQGDSGDTTTDIANQTVDKHLADGVDAIVGAASSGVSFTVIDKITGAGVIHFSPANTSPDFTDYDDNGLYFRTAPSDVLQGRVLSDLIVEEGYTAPFIFARQDPYGEGLLKFTKEPLEAAGATVTDVVYDPNATDFSAEVDQAVTAAPDVIVLIGFAESEQIIKEMIAKGIGPDAVPLLLVDGNIGNALGENFPDGELAGVRGTLPSAELTSDFKDRLLEVDPELTDFSYGPETYDAVIITALAAEEAGCGDPKDTASKINGVTKDGTACTTFADCKKLIEDGEDIDYDGAGGPYAFIDAGEPSEASFAILQYGPDSQTDDSLTEYKFAKLSG